MAISRKTKIISLILIPIVLIGTIAVIGQLVGGGNLPFFGETTQEPDSFRTIRGQIIKLSDHEGEVVILFFFDLKCTPCEAQADILADIYNDYKDEEVFIILITVLHEDSDQGLIEFAQEHDLDELIDRIVRDDPSNTIASEYDISYTPTTIILDKNGKKAERMVGADEGSYENMKDAIEDLL